MELKKVYDKVHFLEFDSRENMANSFKRLYGHYESPEFRGKIFSDDEFHKWYEKNTRPGKYGAKFSKIARGFNIPRATFLPFFYGKFDPLSIKEKRLLESVSPLINEDFYVISTGKDDESNFRHELAHGMFYANSEYADEVLNYLRNIPRNEYDWMVNEMRLDGMCSEPIIPDEIHAQLLTDYYVFYKRQVMKMNKLEEYSFGIKRIFDKHK